jgi:hypothetical protein
MSGEIFSDLTKIPVGDRIFLEFNLVAQTWAKRYRFKRESKNERPMGTTLLGK